jgi:folate-binding protein YgfZ
VTDSPLLHTAATSLETAYEAMTRACALVDRSERGKLALVGPAAKEFLNGQVTNDIEALAPGDGCYAAILTPKGKMLGDLRVLDLGEELFLDLERVALQEVFNVLRTRKIGFEAELEKRTLERGLVSLIGPSSHSLAGGPEGPEHANAATAIDGVATTAIATDLGIDLLCDSADSERLIAALTARGAVVVDEPAAEVVRVESGRPRYGIDLDDSTIPQEAGLNERAVSFTKGCYVGQETVARLHWKGKPNRHLRGLMLSDPVPTGTALRLGERAVATLGSSVSSPAFGPIGLALVRREAQPGDVVYAAGSEATATVVELPFGAAGDRPETA